MAVATAVLRGRWDDASFTFFVEGRGRVGRAGAVVGLVEGRGDVVVSDPAQDLDREFFDGVRTGARQTFVIYESRTKKWFKVTEAFVSKYDPLRIHLTTNGITKTTEPGWVAKLPEQ